jgi:succinate-semialdehyde dehydrogenase/glutarate-semialdehyde dehydrogenase
MVAKFRNGGQSCIAANRIYVQRGIHDDFLAAFADGSARLRSATAWIQPPTSGR